MLPPLSPPQVLSPALAPAGRRTLRPGLGVFRRDDQHLQVGLDPPWRLVVRDLPELRRLLDDLQHGRRSVPGEPVVERLRARLHDAGLTVDADALDAALAGHGDRALVLATFSQHGDEAPARLAARRAARVVLEAAPDARETIRRLLLASGLRDLDGRATDHEPPTVTLLVSDDELARSRVDDAVRLGRPHLVVSGGPVVCVGPFVVPGVTACLRCTDAHRGDADPRRALVLEQCGRRPPGAAPADPLLRAQALATAARDLVSFIDGDRPATWSASIRLGPGPQTDRREWTRHPHCGCAWDNTLVAGW